MSRAPESGVPAHSATVVAMRESRTGVLILDDCLSVVLADSRALQLLEAAGAPDHTPEDMLQRLCADAAGSGSAVLDGLCARIVPLGGSGGKHVALLLEPLYTREALEGAAARFRLSPRESDVVRCLLGGASVSEIAGGLGIAESTVGDYLKRLFAKTRVRNRSEMIAKLLGWHAPEHRP